MGFTKLSLLLLLCLALSAGIVNGLNGSCDLKFSDLHHSITTLLCPANCWKERSTLCGNGEYANGPICLAAMHDQWIDGSGGPVTVYRTNDVADRVYRGTKRNLVTSNSCQKNGTFHTFQMTCKVTGDSATKVTNVWCPADCTNEPVYGTGIYSVQSSVCAAAVHAGKLTAKGGLVRFLTAPGQVNYRGSKQNGVTSLTDGSASLSFSFASCPRSHFNFSGAAGNYVAYNKTFQPLSSATMCAWVTLRSTSRVQGIYSYLTESNVNEFLFEYNSNRHTLVFTVAGQHEDFAINWLPGATHMVCAWFDSTKLGVTVDGTQLNSFTSMGQSVQGGGGFAVGADEHPRRGKYFQNLDGAIGNFVLYSRLLSQAEMTAIAAECRCPHDYVVSMAPDEATVAGDTGTAIPSQCRTVP